MNRGWGRRPAAGLVAERAAISTRAAARRSAGVRVTPRRWSASRCWRSSTLSSVVNDGAADGVKGAVHHDVPVDRGRRPQLTVVGFTGRCSVRTQVVVGSLAPVPDGAGGGGEPQPGARLDEHRLVAGEQLGSLRLVGAAEQVEMIQCHDSSPRAMAATVAGSCTCWRARRSATAALDGEQLVSRARRADALRDPSASQTRRASHRCRNRPLTTPSRARSCSASTTTECSSSDNPGPPAGSRPALDNRSR